MKTLRLRLGKGVAIHVSETMLDTAMELDITKVVQTEKPALQKWNEIVKEKLLGGVKIQFLFTG
jgi:hypothetical protein